MNKAEIRSLAREISELDQVDASDASLDMYIKDGYDRIMSLERRWPWLETSGTLTTVVDQRDYALSLIGAGNLREITSIVNPAQHARLQLISYDQGEDVYLTVGADSNGEPRFYSTWASNLQLWPKPDSAYTLLVRGYREPSDWHDFDGVEVDADPRLHRPLVYFTVSHLYQLQEDTEMAAYYMSTFEQAVKLAHRDITRVPSHVPLVLSGGDPRYWDA